LIAETRSSKFIVIGSVKEATHYTSADDPEGIAGTKYVVNVRRVLKGPALRQVIVNSENTSSRFPMQAGQHYLLFIKGSPSDGFVDTCGNSGDANDKKNMIAKLSGQIIKSTSIQQR
jgi:hypothetical protein